MILSGNTWYLSSLNRQIYPFTYFLRTVRRSRGIHHQGLRCDNYSITTVVVEVTPGSLLTCQHPRPDRRWTVWSGRKSWWSTRWNGKTGVTDVLFLVWGRTRGSRTLDNRRTRVWGRRGKITLSLVISDTIHKMNIQTVSDRITN